MIIKNSSYGEKWGLLDPKVLERTKSKPIFTDTEASKAIDLTKVDFATARKAMGSPNKDITSQPISGKNILVKCHNRYLPAIVCKPKNTVVTSNACLYLHGGGFIGGTAKIMQNQCRLIAEKANCTVISLDYRLAPETPFPGALDDAIESIEWIISQQDKIGFKNSQIFIAGDSAGGNLAIGCGLLDTKHLIKQIISIYGALDLQKVDRILYKWDYSVYQMDSTQRNYIHTRLNKIMYITNLMRPLYLHTTEVTNPLVSPVYSNNLVNMPPVTMIEAEFDYFLPSNKYFVKLLQKNNVYIKEIMYKGLDHGFFDRLGYLKQTEEVCLDIADIIKNN